MSIYVSIKINNDVDLIDLKIGSEPWPKEPNDIHDFFVTQVSDKNWDNASVFTHRYGDGMGICVQKALTAFLANKEPAKHGHEW